MGECVRSSLDREREYIDTLINNSDNCNVLLSVDDLKDLGFSKVGINHYNGWYGVKEKPSDVLESNKEEGYEYIFNGERNNCFEICFSLWRREKWD